MGPIKDSRGLEQGGLLSSSEFQLVGNRELSAANDSGLGIYFGPIHVASDGAADDTVLFSHSKHGLQSLLNLSLKFCQDLGMQMVQSKTHLIELLPRGSEVPQDSKSILLNDSPIPPSEHVEHLGILRSNSLSNLPAIRDRIAKHKKALFPVLSCGAALGHNGNPAANLMVEKLYAAPVLYNGLGGLVLSKQELNILQSHQTGILQQLMGLYPKTPYEAVSLLSAVAPAPAQVAIRMLSLFGMISRLGPSNILFQIGLHQLRHQVSSSWFLAVQELTRQYLLPEALHLLCHPLPKEQFRKLVKSKVLEFSHKKLCASVLQKSSLIFLRAEFLPLTSGPHPLWESCGSSRSAIKAAKIQAIILSGRYRDFKLLSKFNEGDSETCKLPGCSAPVGDCTHLLSGECLALKDALSLTLNYSLFLLTVSCSFLQYCTYLAHIIYIYL